jgi:hypothetical protein
MFFSYGLFPQNKSTIKLNGVFESSMNFIHSTFYGDATNDSQFKWGWINKANLRFRADINEYVSFGFAFNINTLTGSYNEFYKYYYLLEAASYTTSVIDPDNINTGYFRLPFYYKNTYIGSFELERLYLKGGNSYFSIESGLIRIARGYGYSFSPTDLFNPVNPLDPSSNDPSSRPDGKLAVLATFYPLTIWKIENFVIVPENPLESRGWDFKFGLATNFYIDKFNFEFLYALFMPQIEYKKNPEDFNLPQSTNNFFTHIAGFSFKADIVIGLFVDMIYRFEQKSFYSHKYYGKDFKGYEGLEAAIGFDYTFNGGWVYILMEYMFYGSGMLDWGDKSLNEIYEETDWENIKPIKRSYNPEKKVNNFLRHDYIFGMIKVKVNDYLNLGTSYLFGADDQSAILTLFAEIEPLQAFTINISGLYPFDWKMVNNKWEAGEFGYTNLGFFQNYKLTVKIRF